MPSSKTCTITKQDEWTSSPHIRRHDTHLSLSSSSWDWRTHFYQSLDITPISLGPNTPRPNRAESAVRLLKAQLKIMLNSIKSGNAPATLKKVTCRQLVKAAATVRNQTVSYGDVTFLELAFGRRPADLIQLDVATPTQLTIDRNEEKLAAIQIKQLSEQAFQEARQCKNFRMSSKPLQVKDKVFNPRFFPTEARKEYG